MFHAITLERSSFRKNPTYFPTFIERRIRNIICGAIDGSRSEMSPNRQTDGRTAGQTCIYTPTDYSNPRCACAPRVNDHSHIHVHIHTCKLVLSYVYMYNTVIILPCLLYTGEVSIHSCIQHGTSHNALCNN